MVVYLHKFEPPQVMQPKFYNFKSFYIHSTFPI